MKLLIPFFLLIHTFSLAQEQYDDEIVTFNEPVSQPINTDTIYATTPPLEGLKAFRKRLEMLLSEADSTGKKYEIRLDNIAFIVGRDGKINDARVIFYRRPLYYEIIKHLNATPWQPAEQDGVVVASRQELYSVKIFLTKSVLKRYGCWPSLTQRILPCAN